MHDIKGMRRQNQKLILDMIYKSGVISRAQLSKRLGLSKPAVNEHVDFLISTGIIHEIGEGAANAKGGRKPILIAPNENYKYIIAIDLGLSKPLAALGNMLEPALEKVLIDVNGKGSGLNESIRQAINGLLEKRGTSRTEIGVIVVSTPGIVNNQNQIIFRNKQHEVTYDKELFEFLSKEYGRQVLIKNDVNMAVLAEKEVLEHKGHKDYILLACGNGFGAGIIINNKLVEGHHKAAGEVGFMRDEGRTLEETITVEPLLKKIKANANEHTDSELSGKTKLNFQAVLEAYRRDDPLVLSALREVGYKLGVCANDVMSLLDLELILLGGDYIAFQDILIPEMKKVIDEAGHFNKPDIIPASLGNDSGVVGCMHVARDYLINNVENENGGNQL